MATRERMVYQKGGRMKQVNVSIDFSVPDDVSQSQFEEWFKCEILEWGGIKSDNPLLNEDKSDLVSSYFIW